MGSNTVHLLVVDAHRGGHPTPMSSTKATLRLAEATDSAGKITKRGADKLISTLDEFAKIADSSGCAELMAFATSAVRDAGNSDDVLSRVRKPEAVLLVEGATDVMGMHECLPNLSGLPASGLLVLGTYGSGLHAPQVEALTRLQPQAVVLGFDRDEAGQEATTRAFSQLAPLGVPISVAYWDRAGGAKDAGELPLIERAAIVQRALDQAA